jgi:ABC-type transport system involved in cytochrome bd biosynthesis fused ATPase/permease subunit
MLLGMAGRYTSWHYWVQLGLLDQSRLAAKIASYYFFKPIAFSILPWYLFWQYQSSQLINPTFSVILIVTGLLFVWSPKKAMRQLFFNARWQYKNQLINLLDQQSFFEVTNRSSQQFLQLDQKLIVILEFWLCILPNIIGFSVSCLAWWSMIDAIMVVAMMIWLCATFIILSQSLPTLLPARRSSVHIERQIYHALESCISARLTRFHQPSWLASHLQALKQQQSDASSTWYQLVNQCHLRYLLGSWLWVLCLLVWCITQRQLQWHDYYLLACWSLLWAMIQQQIQWFWSFNTYNEHWFEVKQLMVGIKQDRASLDRNLVADDQKFTGLVINNLYFSRSHYHLGPFTKHVRVGQKIALVGQIGSGKSTLLNLLAGILSPSKGTIEAYDHQSISPIHQLLYKIAYAPQSTELLPCTISDNIRFYDPFVSDEQVAQFMQSIGAPWLGQLIDGCNTVLTSGSQLSGGQKRQVQLARVCLSNRPIWLFDEPTIHLDRLAANRFYRWLSKQKNVTILIAGHQLPDHLAFDQIWDLNVG